MSGFCSKVVSKWSLNVFEMWYLDVVVVGVQFDCGCLRVVLMPTTLTKNFKKPFPAAEV